MERLPKFHITQPYHRHRLHFSQQVAKFAVVDLHSVIQIQADALVGIVAEGFVEGGELRLPAASG